MKPSETIGRQRRRQWVLRAAVVAALGALIVPWNPSSATGRVDRAEGSRSVVPSRPLVATDSVTATATATALPTTTITASGAMTATPGASSTPPLTASPTTPTSGTLNWDTSLTQLPVALARPAVAVGSNGDIYAFGGAAGYHPDYDTTYIYSPRGNRWRQGASMPVVREGAQAVTLSDGRIAVLGGATPCDGSTNGNICDGGMVYNRVDVYTPGTDSWATLAPMHSPRYRFAAVLYQGQIYAMGGSDGKAVVASVESYDLTSNAWRDVASLPRSLEGPAAVVDNARIDVFGGFSGQANGGPIYDSHYTYDGSAWTTGTPLLQATTDAGAALGPDGQVYVIGGFDTGFLATVQAYDPRAGRWSYAPSLPVPTCCMGAVTAANGQLYAVGADGPGPNPRVAAYGPYVSTADPARAPGSATTVVGNGFAPGDTVDLYWGATNGSLLSQTTADVYGQIRVAVTIPVTATTGYHTITALDAQAAYPVTTQFVVCDCTTPATPTALSTAIPDASAIPMTTITATAPTTLSTPTVFPTGTPTGLTFGSPMTYSVGSRPAYVAVGDFDGDGKPDLAVVNSGDNTVSVLRGRGDGTFAPAITYTVGVSPEYVVARDVNGDGKPDLVVANSGDNTVSVLFGRGDGTFASPVSYAAGANPQFLAAADFNGDGMPDLAVANFGPTGGHTVSVLLNRGDGTFGGVVSYDAGPGPRSVAAADLTGNGKIDLVVASNTSGDVTVLRGRGDGTFAPPVAYDSGSAQPSIVALGDLDGDGRPDIAVIHDTGDSATIDHVSVLRGRGDGTFGSATSYATGPRPQDVIVADLAGNGHPDLAVANTRGSTIGVYPSNGDGTFGSPAEIAAGEGPHSVAAADLTGDGKLDLIVTNLDSNSVGVLRNGVTPGTPTSTPVVTPITSTPTTAIGLAWDTSRTSLPRGRARPAVAVGRDGNIYAFGGLAFSHPNGVYTGAETATTYIYHPLTNTWTQGAPMPTAREGARAITLPDGRIAVLGGGAHCVGNSDLCDTGTVTNRVDVYDPGADAWSSLAPMRSPRYRFAAALYHGRIYAIGGSNGSSVLSSVESYDPATDSWSAAASLPRPEEGPVAVTDGTGRIDVIGGLVVSSTTYDTLFLFDGTAWSSGPHLLEPINDAGATLGPDGRVYAIGGFDANAYRYTARAQVYDPRKATWSEAAPLPVPVSNMGAVMAVGGQLYAMGAYDGDFVPGVEAQVAIYGPSIGVDSLGALPGATLTVSGTGFTPNGTVSLSLDSSGALGLIEGTADVSGTISLPLTVPLTTTNGPHTVTALDVGASYPVTTSIVVRTGDTVTTPTGTAPPSGGTVPGSATASPAATKDVATIVVSATDTSTATTAPVSTPSPIPATSTSTPTVRPIPSTTATGTPTPALTATATSTNTPVLPAVTSVPRAPTDTPAPVGATAPSATPTHALFAATPTSTLIPPTNIPATVTAAPTNAPPSAGTPDPSSTPTTASTGGGAATGSRMLPATSVPTRPSTGHESGGVTIVFVDVSHGNVASGGTVGVRLRTTPHALVGITLRLTHTSYALVKHGAHRARVARTQVLFRSLTHPRADARGQAREGIRIAYATARALSATLTITAHLPSGSATQSQPVTIQPAHVHRQQTRPRP